MSDPYHAIAEERMKRIVALEQELDQLRGEFFKKKAAERASSADQNTHLLRILKDALEHCHVEHEVGCALVMDALAESQSNLDCTSPACEQRDVPHGVNDCSAIQVSEPTGEIKEPVSDTAATPVPTHQLDENGRCQLCDSRVGTGSAKADTSVIGALNQAGVNLDPYVKAGAAAESKSACRACGKPCLGDDIFCSNSCYENGAGDYILKLEAQLSRNDTSVCMGVGDGSGNLFVYGSHEAIKACQALILQKTRGSGSGAASKTAEPGSTPGPGASNQEHAMVGRVRVCLHEPECVGGVAAGQDEGHDLGEPIVDEPLPPTLQATTVEQAARDYGNRAALEYAQGMVPPLSQERFGEVAAFARRAFEAGARSTRPAGNLTEAMFWLNAARAADAKADLWEEAMRSAKPRDRRWFEAKAQGCSNLAEDFRDRAYKAKVVASTQHEGKGDSDA